MARPSMGPCDTGEVIVFDDLTHWLHWDAPDRINPLLASWLADPAPEGPKARR
jgi:pimeloyl-ACP methyl ester carboxylesterase